MKIISVVGARPNFMKIAPFIRAIADHNKAGGGVQVHHILVHTGQHYDDKMSQAFFDALEIPPADINLGVGSGTHAEQVGHTMIAFEKVVRAEKPDWVVVVGDVNATCACAITAKKEHVKLAHIEAGLRSWDISMPEEVNRLVTDRLADLLLTPDTLSSRNLLAEGVAESRIVFVGNIMIDTLEAQRDKAAKMALSEIIHNNLVADYRGGISFAAESDYTLMTMHRPGNVDRKDILSGIIHFLLEQAAKDMPLIWPIHPRTRQRLQDFGLWDQAVACPGLLLLHPLGYHEMLRLNMTAKMVLTDSGGLQEECCVLGTPCLTLRWNTERPITLQEHGGAGVLVGNSVQRLRAAYQEALSAKREPARPELWDGKTAGRCLHAILSARGN